jgi:hypothetical protein
MASALLFLMIATSVLNRKDLSYLPNIRIPVQVSIISGTFTMFFLRFPVITGMDDILLYL